MAKDLKLFLYSLEVSDAQFSQLDKLLGKTDRGDIRFSVIVNATDIIPNANQWVPSIIKSLKDFGYNINIAYLKKHANDIEYLTEEFSKSDVIWVCGGHIYYLRWILKESGADNIIIEEIKKGKVYAGWSAGAIVAGPTTRHFELMGDDQKQAPEQIDMG